MVSGGLGGSGGFGWIRGLIRWVRGGFGWVRVGLVGSGGFGWFLLLETSCKHCSNTFAHSTVSFRCYCHHAVEFENLAGLSKKTSYTEVYKVISKYIFLLGQIPQQLSSAVDLFDEFDHI